MLSPDQSALVVVGGVTAERVRELATPCFAGLKPVVALPRSIPNYTFPKHRVRGILTYGADAFLVEAFAAPAAFADDRPAFEAAFLLASELTSSRLNRALRERAGQTYGVYASYEPLVGEGSWHFETSFEPRVLRKVLRTADEELARLRSEPVTQDELARAKLMLLERHRARTHLTSEAADAIAEAFVLFTSEAELDVQVVWDRYRRSLEQLDAASIQRAAQRYMDEAERATVVVGPLFEFREDLQKWNPKLDIWIPEAIRRDLKSQGVMLGGH